LEVCLKDWFQYELERSLYHPVADGGNRKNAHFLCVSLNGFVNVCLLPIPTGQQTSPPAGPQVDRMPGLPAGPLGDGAMSKRAASPNFNP
jgi:hypothetical protein